MQPLYHSQTEIIASILKALCQLEPQYIEDPGLDLARGRSSALNANSQGVSIVYIISACAKRNNMLLHSVIFSFHIKMQYDLLRSFQ